MIDATRNREDFILLAQIELADGLFATSGGGSAGWNLYFCITRADLLARNFNNVRMILQGLDFLSGEVIWR